MKIHKIIENEILLRNNSPISDFDNLSANIMHRIIYETDYENSPVKIKRNLGNDLLDKVSLFRLAEYFIKIIDREKSLKLTPMGALPIKILVELYDQKYVLEELIERGIAKISKEGNCISILSTKIVLEIAGITKKHNGKLTLTEKGTSFLKEEKRQEFFELFISVFANKFNWGYNDYYPSQPVGQVGWAFTIYLLNKYGKGFKPNDFYGEKYLKAFPGLYKGFEVEMDFLKCYSVRTFERFLEWFGFIEIKRSQNLSSQEEIRRTLTLENVFDIEI